MRTIDTFMFCNEYDLLELRLSEHYNHVDKIIIIECDRTYTGVYKGFNLEKHLDRYTQWMDKIEYIKVENSPTHSNAWANEEWQRNQMNRGWTDITDTDLLLVSDLDEIIRPETFEFMKNTDYDFYALMLPTSYFKLNYIDTKEHYSGWGRAFRRYTFPGYQMRNTNGEHTTSKVKVHHAGWHFGWLGDEEFIKNKLKSFSHTEFDNDFILGNIDIEDNVRRGRVHIYPEQDRWKVVKLNEYFPKSLMKNKEKYKNYILPENEDDNAVQYYWSNNILEIEQF